MRKKLLGLLVCSLVAFSMPVFAAEGTGTGFIFANTKGLLIGNFDSETTTASGSSAAALPMGTEKKDDANTGTAQGISTDNTEKPAGSSVQTQTLAPAPTDYDNVEMGDNMLQATVDGTRMTFYLANVNTLSSDGYELKYISFTPEGEARYSIYLRIPRLSKAGTYDSNGKGPYSSGGGHVLYFELSTSYDKEKGQWGGSNYKAVYRVGSKPHSSTNPYGNWGSYTFTLDQDMGFDKKEISGTFSAELEGYSSSTEGKTISITDGVFRAVKEETHEVVQEWQSGNIAGSSGGWADPYAGTDKQEKKVCSKCGGTGKVICSYCNGAGTILQRKEGIDLGSGSTGYTVEVDCRACDGGYYKCSRCGGSGYEY